MKREEQHLGFLDGFRGVAILGVLVSHCLSRFFEAGSASAKSAASPAAQLGLSLIQAVIHLGTFGVAVFFVVSGFCIHLSHRRSQNAGWLVFFTRRIFRIYPAYLFSLFLFILILPITRWTPSWPLPTANVINLGLHLFLAHNLLPQTLTSISIPYWSLAIEFQLYLLFPLLLVMTSRLGWRQTLMVTAFVELVSRAWLTFLAYHQPEVYPGDWWGWLDLSPLGFWFSWSLGAAMAEAFLANKELPMARSPVPYWTWLLLMLVFDNTPYLKCLAFPAAALSTTQVMAYFVARETSAIATARPGVPVRILNFFGVISYSIYLLHMPLYSYFVTFWPLAHGNALTLALKFVCVALSLTAVVAASYLLFRWVEIPGINLGKTIVKKIRRRQNDQAAVAASIAEV